MDLWTRRGVEADYVLHNQRVSESPQILSVFPLFAFACAISDLSKKSTANKHNSTKAIANWSVLIAQRRTVNRAITRVLVFFAFCFTTDANEACNKWMVKSFYPGLRHDLKGTEVSEKWDWKGLLHNGSKWAAVRLWLTAVDGLKLTLRWPDYSYRHSRLKQS